MPAVWVRQLHQTQVEEVMDIDEIVLTSLTTEEERIAEQEADFVEYKERLSTPGAFQQVSLVDLNMMSGSSESLRTALGGYFKNVPKAVASKTYTDADGTTRTRTSDELRLTTPPAFIGFDPRPSRNINPYIHSVTSYGNEKINENLRLVEGETGFSSLETGAAEDELSADTLPDTLQRDTGLATRYQDTVLPSTKFVVHIEGDPYAYGQPDTILTDMSKGNKFWRTLWTGGEFAEKTYTSLYQNAVYDDHYIHFPMHYRKSQIKALFPEEDKASSYASQTAVLDKYLETTFQYNKHLKGYQNFVDEIDDIKLIPNYYLMHSVKKYFDPFVEAAEGDFDAADSLYRESLDSYMSSMMPSTAASYKINNNIADYYTFSNLIPVTTFASFFDDLGSPVYPEGFELDDGTLYEAIDPLPFEGYLDVLMPKFYNEIKQETKDYVSSIQKNIFFNHNARRLTKGSTLEDDDGDQSSYASVSNQRRFLPFYTTIAFEPLDAADEGVFSEISTNTLKVRESLEKFNCSTMVLRGLKECFLSQEGEKSTITPTMKQFVVNQTMLERTRPSLGGGGDGLVEGISSGDYDPTTATPSADSRSSAYFDYADRGSSPPFIDQTISNVATFRTVDFTEMMIHNIMNFKNINHDFCCIDGDTIECLAAYDKKGVYRAYNTKNALNALNEIVSKFPTVSGDSAHRTKSFYSLFNSSDDSEIRLAFTDSIHKATAAASKEYEIIAYRVEKTGGPGTGDSSTREVLQNFWFWNSAGNLDGVPTSEWPFRFIDSQIKYNENYTYQVYAYYLVNGVKYETSNFQLSKIIGPVYDREYNPSAETGEKVYDYDEQEIKGYCIEMYNPETGEPAPDLLQLAAYGPLAFTGGPDDLGGPATYEDATLGLSDSGANTVSTSFASLLEELQISSYSTEAQRIAVSRASSYDTADGGTYSIAPPYMANFIVTAQPSFKIIEIPIERKTFKITDNPPNSVNATPGYARDNSNKILFELHYQPFNATTYPVSLSDEDMANRTSYVSGKDVTFFNHVKESSVSRLSNIEIYRMDKLPEFFSDFNNNLREVIDVKIKGTNASYNSCIYSDIIKSNTKYYYLFRAVNENSIGGYIDNVLEVELVNDGGYKYPIFKTLYDTDIEQMREENSFGKVAKEVKNLFELVPSYSQTYLDDSAAEYNNPANTEYENIKIGRSGYDSIWGKTFKLRLTSKKTGKKIDLNITYNDPIGNLTED